MPRPPEAATSPRCTRSQRRPRRFGGAGVELPEQHGFRARPDHGSKEAILRPRRQGGLRALHLRHAHSPTRSAEGTYHLDRARNRSQSLSPTPGRRGRAGGRTRRPRAGANEQTGSRPLLGHAPTDRGRLHRARRTVACRGLVAVQNAPRRTGFRQELGHRLERQGNRSTGVPSGASRSNSSTTAFETRTQPCDTACPSSPG